MKILDCNQIKIFINLEIIREKDKDKKIYIYFFILGFVDNILDRHNCYSCKSNTTFFHYLIYHIYPKNMCGAKKFVALAHFYIGTQGPCRGGI